MGNNGLGCINTLHVSEVLGADDGVISFSMGTLIEFAFGTSTLTLSLGQLGCMPFVWTQDVRSIRSPGVYFNDQGGVGRVEIHPDWQNTITRR